MKEKLIKGLLRFISALLLCIPLVIIGLIVMFIQSLVVDSDETLMMIVLIVSALIGFYLLSICVEKLGKLEDLLFQKFMNKKDPN